MEGILSSFTSFGHEDAHGRYQHIYHTEEIHPHHKSSFTHEGIVLYFLLRVTCETYPRGFHSYCWRSWICCNEGVRISPSCNGPTAVPYVDEGATCSK